jgi:hypothetical protein
MERVCGSRVSGYNARDLMSGCPISRHAHPAVRVQMGCSPDRDHRKWTDGVARVRVPRLNELLRELLLKMLD